MEPVLVSVKDTKSNEKHLINSHDRSPSMHQHQVFVELVRPRISWGGSGAEVGQFLFKPSVWLANRHWIIWIHPLGKVAVACRSQSDREVNRRWSTLPSAWWQAGTTHTQKISKDIIEYI